MSSHSFQDAYAHTRLSDKNQQVLQKKFQGFGSVFAASMDLFTRHWWKGFVAPWLWMLLFDFVFAVFTIGLMFAAVWDLAVTQAIRTGIELNSSETVPEPTGQEIATFVLVLCVSILIPSIVSGAFRYWLQLKQFAILNNTKVHGIWRTSGSYLDRAGKGIMGYILVSLMVLPAVLVSIIMIGYGYISMAVSVIQADGGDVSAEMLEFFDTFALLNPAVAIAVIFLGIAILGSTQFIQGFVGLFEQLIVHENTGVIASIGRSYRLSKQKFWSNILRWFVFILILAVISMGINFVQQILSTTMQFILFVTVDFSSIEQSGAFPSELFGVYGVSILIYSFFQAISQLLIWSLTTAFVYSAFYNFRHTVTDPVEVGQSEQSSQLA